MELEFDKEIDALLRKANRASPGAQGAPAAGHLDADELAAFAENALPDLTRQMYMTHLADCDGCRKMLSGFVSIAPEQAVAAAASAPTAATPSGSVSWYQTFFKSRNLGYAMGAMVVLFSGIIGLLVYQNKSADRSAEISKVRDSSPSAVTQANNDSPQASTNSSTLSNSNASSTSPIENLKQTGVAVGSANVAIEPTNDEKNPPADKVTSSDVAVSEPKLASAPTVGAPQQPPPAKPAELPENGRNVTALKAESERDKKKDEQAAVADEVIAQNNDQRTQREMAPNAKSAPRTNGPRQVQSQTQINQNQIQNLPQGGASVMSNLKTSGGKTFEMRDGIWYDTSYTGQGKKDVKRGTEKFLRLDAGLRSIADQIGGTVVVLWNGQAYKIR
jgi:hypothetical protein